MREILAEQLGAAVCTRVTRPHMPDAAAWRVLSQKATISMVRGPAGEAALVLRDAQAARFVRAVFGENVEEAAGVSALERTVLDRAMTQLCSTLVPVCGAPLSGAVPAAAIDQYTTYFEIMTEAPLLLRIGVAVRSEPVTPPSPVFDVDQLRTLPFTATLRYGKARITAAEVMGLAAGAIVAFDSGSCEQAALAIAGTHVARGVPGAAGSQRALRVEAAR
ncbi:MAG TPA: FliM/FliN family flagellar motor C-terminal domain-containing protein [Candidatus Baltobacteraceae bacterium]|nr:FliM/FliN family flagellar motor C-terminal domain-containing protein [Candidatus Baltobacteraceae bacterium]